MEHTGDEFEYRRLEDKAAPADVDGGALSAAAAEDDHSAAATGARDDERQSRKREWAELMPNFCFCFF